MSPPKKLFAERHSATEIASDRVIRAQQKQKIMFFEKYIEIKISQDEELELEVTATQPAQGQLKRSH